MFVKASCRYNFHHLSGKLLLLNNKFCKFTMSQTIKQSCPSISDCLKQVPANPSLSSVSAGLVRWTRSAQQYNETLSSNKSTLEYEMLESYFHPWYVHDERVGYLPHKIANLLTKTFPDAIGEEERDGQLQIHVSSSYCDTDAFSKITKFLYKDANILTSWRNELYPIRSSFNSVVHFSIERAAANLFGIKTFGSHMNGYCIEQCSSNTNSQMLQSKPTHMWIAKRSLSKSAYPGKLDNLVAGGISTDLTVKQTMIKECQEEAGIPIHCLDNLKQCSMIEYARMSNDRQALHSELLTQSHETEVVDGILVFKHGLQFIWDLQLPNDFIPHNEDGEVEQFEKLTIQQVMHLVAFTDSFKWNCNLVIIDFLLRHGFINADEYHDYCEISTNLR